MSIHQTTWRERVRDLQALGMTYADIGGLIGLRPSSVGDIANGYAKAPTGDAAVALHALHIARCTSAKQPVATAQEVSGHDLRPDIFGQAPPQPNRESDRDAA